MRKLKEEILPKNTVEFQVSGREALFTDPLTRGSGEKYTYPVPTYQALKGILESIYWKPTILWVVDEVRIMNQIRTYPKGMRPIKYEGGNTLSIYTYLTDVVYQVRAHFEWNMHRPQLKEDRNDGKHFAIAKRCIERGGRRDVYLGLRECQAYVEPCLYGEGEGFYDNQPAMSYGVMFHGYDYPDETGRDMLAARLWSPVIENGIIKFIRPEECKIRNDLRPMKAKEFRNILEKGEVDDEAVAILG